MKNIKLHIVITILIALSSCIRNDIPYPEILAEFTELSVEGQKDKSIIDKKKMLITLPLEEYANPAALIIKNVKTNEGVNCPLKVGDTINLTKQKDITLSLYQEYNWTIKASQTIEYAFAIEKQIGTTLINEKNHTALAYINASNGKRNVVVRELKLGPAEITKHTPSKEEMKDFTLPQKVTVEYNGKTEVWTLSIQLRKGNVFTKPAFEMTTSAWLNGSGTVGIEKSFEYRKKDEGEWIKIEADKIEGEDVFTYHLKDLSPNTTYEYRAITEKEKGDIVEFTTTEEQQIPDSAFDNWWNENKSDDDERDKGKWNPWKQGGTQTWDTSNKGSIVLGKSNVIPVEETATGEGLAAKLESKFLGFSQIGKFAAGTIFVGDFLKVDVTSGQLNFGKQFEAFPTHLKGYFKYKSEKINRVDKESPDLEKLRGLPDSCFIYVALLEEPVFINNKPSVRKLFDKADNNIIAYGEKICGESVTDWTKFDIPIVYKKPYGRRPKYIAVVCTSSKYGDYYVGGEGSTLWLDNFKLTYD